jgi:ubiquinol-cytochrome c reductase iron-sulfur subunit
MSHTNDDEGATRREFLYLTAGAMGAVGAACAAWPLVDSMNPAADTLALAKIEVDLTGIEPGQSKTEMWLGKPVFIKRRTTDEIAAADSVNTAELRDPQKDDERVDPKHKEWLVLVGVCTHLGCVPSGQKVTDSHGDFGGWFCPCHGSHYDTSGRIRKGPAPKNMAVPPVEFLSDTKIRIG